MNKLKEKPTSFDWEEIGFSFFNYINQGGTNKQGIRVIHSII